MSQKYLSRNRAALCAAVSVLPGIPNGLSIESLALKLTILLLAGVALAVLVVLGVFLVPGLLVLLGVLKGPLNLEELVVLGASVGSTARKGSVVP